MKKILLLPLLLIALALPGYFLGLDAMGWYVWHNYLSPSRSSAGFDLGGYEAAIEGKPIPGFSDASGLTFHEPSGTLFTVLNDEPFILQLDKNGEVLRTIKVNGVSDMEGITHVGGDQFLIVEEGKNQLVLIEIGNEQSIDVTASPKLALGFRNERNKGLEGISWDAKSERILIVSEKRPKRLVEIHGLLKSVESPQAQIAIRELWRHKPDFMRAMRDLASLTYHEDTGRLLLLSEESRLIKEFRPDGQAMSAMLLWPEFHGLKHPVPQAEGITVGPDRKIYIISEPNLFYVFNPAKATH